MTTGVSIHIGLNRVDPTQYNGWNGQLAGCINDANAMRDIAYQSGYNPISVLLDDDATSANVLQAIGQAAQSLDSGDILLLTYSGHGGQVPDDNGDEEDGQDETWVLYDRMLIDDELSLMWSQFAPGVRIVVLSDSCHSGTVVKQMIYEQFAQLPAYRNAYRAMGTAAPAFKAIPQETANLVYRQHEDQYRAIQWTALKGKKASIDATVLLISGCQDEQLSGDGPGNGVFTGALLQVWQSGSFRGDYRAFWNAIVKLMPPTQTPNYFVAGAANPAFEAEQPFSIAGAAVIPSVPQIAPSPFWYAGDPPEFSVSPSPNTYYAVEVTTDASLFDYDNYGSGRTEDNFYASWSDSALFWNSEYTLPQAVWDRLSSSGSVLYYRILTSSAGDGWENIQYSINDDEAWNAPYLELTRSRNLMMVS